MNEFMNIFYSIFCNCVGVFKKENKGYKILAQYPDIDIVLTMAMM